MKMKSEIQKRMECSITERPCHRAGTAMVLASRHWIGFASNYWGLITSSLGYRQGSNSR